MNWRCLYLLVFLRLFYGCGNVEINKTDSNNAFEKDSFKLIPQKLFEINSIVKSSDDTLYIASCSEFVYSPFGKIKNKNDLKGSLLKNFKIVTTKEEMVNGTFEFQKLSLNSNRLVLFFDPDLESAKASYIFKGEIKDSKVQLLYNIGVGMDADRFFSIFFLNSSKEMQGRFHTFILETCVSGTKHIYTLKNNMLQSVKFETSHSYWKVNY